MSKSDKEIKSINDFISHIRGLTGDLLLYRGLSDTSWEVETAAYRRIKRKPEIFQDCIKDLLAEAKQRAFSFGHRQNKELNDLELLAELQHNGAATCLIDFTTNPLIALWFACREPPDKKGKDGKVIALPTSNIDKFKIATPDDLTKNIEHFLTGDTLWKWQPWDINNRIIAQQSTFIIGTPTIKERYYDCLVIKKANKKRLTEELEKLFGISETSLFRDLPGFSVANAHDKEYIPPDYFAQGINKYQSGNFEGALADYDKALALDPGNVSIYYNRGVAKHTLDDYVGAIADYNKTIELDENFSVVYYNCGNAKRALGNYKEAIRDYDQAIKLDPKDAAAYSNRGVAKHALGNRDEAIKDYNQAIALEPNLAEAYSNLGLAKQDLEDHEGAIKDYDEAIRLNQGFAIAYNNRGNAKRILGNYREAIKDCDKAIKIDKNYANAYYNRGLAKHYLEDYEGAIVDYNQAIALNPGYAAAHYNCGLAKHALGNHEEAIKDYNEALKQNKGVATAYHYRGLANKALGNTEQAEKDFATAKDLKSKQTD